MTAKTTYYINSLDPKLRRELNYLRNLPKKTGNPETARAEIRGYLNALKDMGIISDVQFRVLLIYYTNFEEVEDCEKV